MVTKLISPLLRDIDTLNREINTIFKDKFKHYNLQKGQFIFLTRVCENPQINLKHLSDYLKTDKTTTTKAIQKLIQAGFIIKQQDPNDKRIYHLIATEKARIIYDDIIKEKNRAISICCKDMTKEEVEQLSQLINKMISNIGEDWRSLSKNLARY